MILFLHTPEGTFTPTRSGAVATHIYQTAVRAQEQGHDVRVVARTHPEAQPYEGIACDLFAYPNEPEGLALLARRLERKVRSWTHVCYGVYASELMKTVKPYAKPGTTFVVHNDPEIVPWLKSRFPKCRVIHWFHNQHQCKERARKRFPHVVDHAVSVSEYTQAWVKPHYACPASKCSVVYNGVDLEAFTPRVDWPANELPVINFTGRTGSEKGLDIMLDALIRVAKRGTTAFAVQVIGANHWGQRTLDAYQRTLDEQVQTLRGLGVNVAMPGHLDRQATAQAMREAQVHVVPSRWDEPFGLSTVEGMACGLATVVSRTGGSMEVIGDAGLSFEREDAAGLSEVLDKLIQDPAERQRLGQAGRKRAETFSWDRTWSAMADVIAAIA